MKKTLLIVMALLATPALADNGTPGGVPGQVPGTEAQSTLSQHSAVRRVELKYVCMVNEKAFDKPQIPVLVGDKTYYGCCQACKTALENDPKVREAVDPVSGKAVDKSSAVIGEGEDGKIYYFENEGNFEKFGKGN